MITAQEAREISGPSIEELCEFFEPAIRSAADSGERKVFVYHGTLENDAYSCTKRWQDFVAMMRDQYGYTVSLHYEVRQFVDMRIKIEW